ncbi:hypothetical protein [Mesorhizobium sp. M0187]|uniref:hypothetical protein n=1 Tax=Mesorhizobium sp. M0187 TaxID=2956908 RepID=UPI00333C0D75
MISRGCIVEADLWDRSYLNLGGLTMITIGGDNNGKIAFGALQAGLNLSYSPSMFTSHGPDVTRWTKSRATATPNCSTTARSRSRPSDG